MEDTFDAIIVGAGPAGTACAYQLAQAGKTVLLIERGDRPGAKNVTGGRLYTYAFDLLDKNLHPEPALEREVRHEQIMLLDGNRSLVCDLYDPELSKNTISYTVLRAVFDDWFAQQAEIAGAMVASGIRVDDLLIENDRVVGVIAGQDQIRAHMVVAADGANAFLAQKAGLVSNLKSHATGVGLKEVISLPSDTINARFNLRDDTGAARMILGCTEGIHGGGFLYTNKNSISLGCVFMASELAAQKRPVHQLFQQLKLHPAIYQLIEGGQTVEYSAHLVSEAGNIGVPNQLSREGFMLIGDSAGFVINYGYSIRGMDLAMLSGMAAAQAIIHAKDTASCGPLYVNELKRVLFPTMQETAAYSHFLHIPRLYAQYPKLALDIMSQVYAVASRNETSLRKQIIGLIKKNHLSLWQLLRDGIKGVKSI